MVFVFIYPPSVMDPKGIQRLFETLHISDIIYFLSPTREELFDDWKNISFDINSMYNLFDHCSKSEFFGSERKSILAREYKNMIRMLVKKLIYENFYLELDRNDFEFSTSKYYRYSSIKTVKNIAILMNGDNMFEYFFNYGNYYLRKRDLTVQLSMDYAINRMKELEKNHLPVPPLEKSYLEKKYKCYHNSFYSIIDDVKIDQVNFYTGSSYEIIPHDREKHFSVNLGDHYYSLEGLTEEEKEECLQYHYEHGYEDLFFDYIKNEGISIDSLLLPEKRSKYKEIYKGYIYSFIETELQRKYEKDQVWYDDDSDFYIDMYRGAFENDPDNEWNCD